MQQGLTDLEAVFGEKWAFIKALASLEPDICIAERVMAPQTVNGSGILKLFNQGKAAILIIFTI